MMFPSFCSTQKFFLGTSASLNENVPLLLKMAHIKKMLLIGASAVLSQPANAQFLDPNMEFRDYDENGVDLIHGDYRLDFEELSVGNGESKISLTSRFDILQENRTFNITRYSFGLSEYNSGGAKDYTATIGMPDGSYERFTRRGSSAFVNSKNNGTSLSGSGSTFIFTDSVGTQITFGTPVPEDQKENLLHCRSTVFNQSCSLFLTQIRKPSGVTIGIESEYNVTPGGQFTGLSRLSRIFNNFGYSIVFSYSLPVSTPSFPDISWPMPTQASSFS